MLIVAGWRRRAGIAATAALLMCAPFGCTDVPTGYFTPAAPMHAARVLHACATLPDGRVLVTGGLTNLLGKTVISLDGAEVYDPAANRWHVVGPMSTVRFGHTATTLADGRVLITGGSTNVFDFVRTQLASAELFDPATGTFTPTGSMAHPRQMHTATRMPDGRVLIVGGGSAQTEVYDPARGEFLRSATLITPRRSHTATLLADGRVLIASGGSARGEVFDPALQRFVPTANAMDLSLDDQAAVRLHDGRVLLAGGQRLDTGLTITRTWLYDPATNSFSDGPPLSPGEGLGVQDLVAVDLFADDPTLAGMWILLAGGEHDPGRGGRDINLDFAQFYDAVSHTLTVVGPMLDTHDDFCAAALPPDADGRPRVLMIGGHDPADRAHDRCEVFTMPMPPDTTDAMAALRGELAPAGAPRP